VFEACGQDPARVTPVSTEQYAAQAAEKARSEGRTPPLVAPRPRNSVLDLAKVAAAGFAPPEWRSRLAGYLASNDA